MKTVAVGPRELAVDVKAVLDQNTDDLVMAGLGGQQESSVGHVRSLEERLRELTRSKKSAHSLP